MAINDGCKRPAAALCGAVLLLVVALAAADQRGGAGRAGYPMNSPSQDQGQPAANSAALAKARADNEQNIKDAARLGQMAAEVKQELENGGEFTLSVATLRKAEEMEKLSRKLHDRMKADREAAPKPPSGMDASKGRG